MIVCTSKLKCCMIFWYLATLSNRLIIERSYFPTLSLSANIALYINYTSLQANINYLYEAAYFSPRSSHVIQLLCRYCRHSGEGDITVKTINHLLNRLIGRGYRSSTGIEVKIKHKIIIILTFWPSSFPERLFQTKFTTGRSILWAVPVGCGDVAWWLSDVTMEVHSGPYQMCACSLQYVVQVTLYLK